MLIQSAFFFYLYISLFCPSTNRPVQSLRSSAGPDLPQVRTQALWEALAFLRAHRDEIKGRSTLTQQLAKNLYFTPRRSFFRKLNEAVVAKRLEFFLPKDRILEVYLNVVEWGPGTFGAEAAARTYFDRSAKELTLDQAAALAATLPHPLTSNPSFHPGQMAWRKAHLLSRLRGPPPGTSDTLRPPGEGQLRVVPTPVALPLPDTLGFQRSSR